MEQKEIPQYIKVQFQAGKSDSEVFEDLKLKLSSVSSQEEILEMLYQYPTLESQKRLKTLNIILCVLISILAFMRIFSMLGAVASSLRNGQSGLALIAICIGLVFLGIGILFIRKIRRFERSYYKNALALGLLMSAGAVSSLEKAFKEGDPLPVLATMILYLIVLAAAIILDFYLIRKLWPQLTYRNKLKSGSLLQSN